MDDIEKNISGYLIISAKRQEDLIDQEGNLVKSCKGCFFEDIDIDCKCPNDNENYIWVVNDYDHDFIKIDKRYMV